MWYAESIILIDVMSGVTSVVKMAMLHVEVDSLPLQPSATSSIVYPLSANMYIPYSTTITVGADVYTHLHVVSTEASRAYDLHKYIHKDTWPGQLPKER